MNRRRVFTSDGRARNLSLIEPYIENIDFLNDTIVYPHILTLKDTVVFVNNCSLQITPLEMDSAHTLCVSDKVRNMLGFISSYGSLHHSHIIRHYIECRSNTNVLLVNRAANRDVYFIYDRANNVFFFHADILATVFSFSECQKMIESYIKTGTMVFYEFNLGTTAARGALIFNNTVMDVLPIVQSIPESGWAITYDGKIMPFTKNDTETEAYEKYLLAIDEYNNYTVEFPNILTSIRRELSEVLQSEIIEEQRRVKKKLEELSADGLKKLEEHRKKMKEIKEEFIKTEKERAEKYKSFDLMRELSERALSVLIPPGYSTEMENDMMILKKNTVFLQPHRLHTDMPPRSKYYHFYGDYDKHMFLRSTILYRLVIKKRDGFWRCNFYQHAVGDHHPHIAEHSKNNAITIGKESLHPSGCCIGGTLYQDLQFQPKEDLFDALATNVKYFQTVLQAISGADYRTGYGSRENACYAGKLVFKYSKEELVRGANYDVREEQTEWITQNF